MMGGTRFVGTPIIALQEFTFEDMYVDADLQLDTARVVGNTRVCVTNEYEHDGLRVAGERVLGRLMDMAAGLC